MGILHHLELLFIIVLRNLASVGNSIEQDLIETDHQMKYESCIGVLVFNSGLRSSFTAFLVVHLYLLRRIQNSHILLAFLTNIRANEANFLLLHNDQVWSIIKIWIANSIQKSKNKVHNIDQFRERFRRHCPN